MKITLISPYPDITNFGIRSISAYLNQSGHQTRLIFLPDPYGDNIVHGLKRYKDHVLDSIIPLCDDSDIIGISVMTNFFEGAVQITQKIKSELDKLIIWGGVHPTIRAEECLNFADMVCIGEGEDAVLELLNRMQWPESYEDVQNLWFKRNGKVIRNSVRPLTPTLDIYPMIDYSLNEHFIMFESKIQEMTPELLKICLGRSNTSQFIGKIVYQTMTGRGCPHKCSYCVNDTLKNLYKGRNYLRWRSVQHIINELLWVKENLFYVDYIWFSDDSFFARKLKEMEELCHQYKDKIGLPFYCLGSPLTITDEKMDLLLDAGMTCLQMGIQTGSKKIQEVFNRKHMSNERVMKSIQIINKYKDKMLSPRYDFILDTPYETDEDKIETLRFISQIPKPFQLQLFSLVLYPGSQLHEKAKSDGFITDEKKEIYNKSYAMREQSYLNLLFALAREGRFPSFLLRFLVSNSVSRVLNSRELRPFFKYVDIFAKYSHYIVKKHLNFKCDVTSGIS